MAENKADNHAQKTKKECAYMLRFPYEFPKSPGPVLAYLIVILYPLRGNSKNCSIIYQIIILYKKVLVKANVGSRYFAILKASFNYHLAIGLASAIFPLGGIVIELKYFFLYLNVFHVCNYNHPETTR